MKKNIFYLLLLSFVFCFIYVYVFDAKLDLNGDNANYLHYAYNISQGNGYSSVAENGFNPASQYPPAYSTFLAFFMLFGIQNLIFLKVLNGILLLVSLLLLAFIVYKVSNNKPLALVAALLPMFSPHLQHFSNIVMSEMLFLFFTVYCFFSFYKYSENKPTCFWKSGWFYFIILSATGAYYTRTVGMALILAVVVFFLFRKEWRQAILSFLGIVLLNIPWSIRNSIYGIESRYFGTIMAVNPWRPEEGTISTFGELIEKMITNFDETVIKGFKEILFPFMNIDYGVSSGFFAIMGGLLLLAIILYGAWNMKAIRWAMMAYLIGQIGLFMLWHGGNGARYVVPVAPFIFINFYVGLYKLIMLWLEKKYLKKGSKVAEILPYAFLIVAFLMWKPIENQAKIAKQPYPSAYLNYFNIAKEMQKQLPTNTVCVCRKPELFRYYAPNIYPTRYIYSKNPEEVIEDMIKKNVDFVILEQLGYSSTSLYLYPAIEKYPEVFPVVWHLQNPDTYLLRFEKKKAEEKLNITDNK